LDLEVYDFRWVSKLRCSEYSDNRNTNVNVPTIGNRSRAFKARSAIPHT
jgi:hypothetical protein